MGPLDFYTVFCWGSREGYASPRVVGGAALKRTELWRYDKGLAGVLDGLVHRGCRVDSGPVGFGDEDYVERAVLQHAGECSLAVAEG
jgi:hypothetical protein